MSYVRALSLLTVLVMMVAAFSVSAQPAADGATLVGSWQFTISPIRGNSNQFVPFPGLVNLNSDNTLVESDGVALVPAPAGSFAPEALYSSGGFGVWRQVGASKFTIKLVQIVVSGNDNTLAAKDIVNFTVTISRDGSSFAGTGNFEYVDPSGKPIPGFSGEEQIHGQRIEIASSSPSEP